MALRNLFVSQPSNKKFIPLEIFFIFIIKTIILIFFRKKNYDVGDEHSLYLVVKFEANSLIISCLNKAIMTGEAGYKLVPLVLKSAFYEKISTGFVTLHVNTQLQWLGKNS